MRKYLIGDEKLAIFAIVGVTNFAIDIKDVVSIIEPLQTRHVPLAPDYINTIINYQGKVVTVFDVRKYLGYVEKPENAEPKIIYMENPEQNIGLLVDKIKGIDYLVTTGLETIPDSDAERPESDICKSIYAMDERADDIYWLDKNKIEELIRNIELAPVSR